jgi:hypothetical protein
MVVEFVDGREETYERFSCSEVDDEYMMLVKAIDTFVEISRLKHKEKALSRLSDEAENARKWNEAIENGSWG